MAAKKKSAQNKVKVGAIRRIKVLKAETKAEEPDVHVVNLELEVQGDPPPAVITPEAAVEITPSDPEPQIAASGGWVKWLKSIW
jgi:hypothetical protein